LRLAQRLRDLNRVAIDAQDAPAARPRYRPGELRQPAADIQDALAAAQSELPQRSVVEEVIQAGEPLLLVRLCAM
jgi:hypothetical protein